MIRSLITFGDLTIGWCHGQYHDDNAKTFCNAENFHTLNELNLLSLLVVMRIISVVY